MSREQCGERFCNCADIASYEAAEQATYEEIARQEMEGITAEFAAFYTWRIQFAPENGTFFQGGKL